MFGERCYGLANCGHATNWTCPCTCDEEFRRYEPDPIVVTGSTLAFSEVDRLKARIEGLLLYTHHDSGCSANDLDYLDKAPCTCGLRKYFNPKGGPNASGN